MKHPISARITFDLAAPTVVRSGLRIFNDHNSALAVSAVEIVPVVALTAPATLRFIDEAATHFARTADLAHIWSTPAHWISLIFPIPHALDA